jgi:hypothetical protein
MCNLRNEFQQVEVWHHETICIQIIENPLCDLPQEKKMFDLVQKLYFYYPKIVKVY